MKKILFWIVVIIVAVIGYRYIFVVDTPGDFVQRFYEKLMSDEDGYIGNQEYKSFRELDPELIIKMENYISDFRDGGVDPFLCAQDKPVSFTVEEGENIEGIRMVYVREEFGDRSTSSLRLIKVTVAPRGMYANNGWKIIDIACNNASSTEPIAELNKVGDYIRENISVLSPEKEVLGGKFYVTKITWQEKGGLVDYEDGHVAFTASFSYSIQGDTVIISDFTIIK